MVEHLKVESNLSKRDLEKSKFIFLGRGRKQSSRLRIMYFKTLDLNKLRELVGRVSWEYKLGDRRVQETRTLPRKTILNSQQQTIPIQREDRKHSNRPTCLHLVI